MQHTNVLLTKRWLWGMPRPLPWFNSDLALLNKRAFVRWYLRHNSAVIHGVPKGQLLVWDVHKQPEWGPLCDFLGVPVPEVPFPTPSDTDF